MTSSARSGLLVRMERTSTSPRPRHWRLGAKIRAARESVIVNGRPISHDKFVERMGENPSSWRPHLCKIENGKVKPRPETLAKIATAAGTTVEELLSGTDEEEESAAVMALSLDEVLRLYAEHAAKAAVRDVLGAQA